MHAAARKRIEISRQRGNQRLAFAGLDFADAALVQNHATDELDVENDADRSFALPLRELSQRRRQEFVGRHATRYLVPKQRRPRAQLHIGQRGKAPSFRALIVAIRHISRAAAIAGGLEQYSGQRTDQSVLEPDRNCRRKKLWPGHIARRPGQGLRTMDHGYRFLVEQRMSRTTMNFR